MLTDQPSILLSNNFLILSSLAKPYCPSVEPKRASLRELFFKELFDRIHSGLSHLIQYNPCTLKLLFRLDKISAVCPQPCLFRSKQCRSGRAGESGQKLPRLEVLSHIFAVVIICRGDKIDIDPLPQHLAAQRIYSLRNFHCKSPPVSKITFL